jgi:hypothetical protein
MKFVFLALFATLTVMGISMEASACQPCHKRVTRVCDNTNPKRPKCHDVYTCKGGTCGNNQMTIFEGMVFPDSEISELRQSDDISNAEIENADL